MIAIISGVTAFLLLVIFVKILGIPPDDE